MFKNFIIIYVLMHNLLGDVKPILTPYEISINYITFNAQINVII